MDHIKHFEKQLFKVELFTFVYGAIRAHILLDQPYSMGQIFEDFRSFKGLKEREYNYSKLINTLANYEHQIGVERPKAVLLRDNN